MTELHAIVLTFNEEMHIARCLASIRGLCASITVIDSGSRDRTVEIARSFGAEVIANPWVNYATQLNFGIDRAQGRSGWLLRIDADEHLPPASVPALKVALAGAGPDVDGILVRRQIVFLGRRMRWGGIEPSWQLRLWRCGRGACEQRWMDEHIVVQGRVVKSPVEIVDENLNSLDWWTSKHNHYASREVIDILASRGLLEGNEDIARQGASGQAKLKRFVKERIYNRLPGGLRTIAYFVYRYFLRLGFLDGKPGYYFHILQGFWYRTLVDAKLAEVLMLSKQQGLGLSEAVKKATGIDVAAREQRQAAMDTAPQAKTQQTSINEA